MDSIEAESRLRASYRYTFLVLAVLSAVVFITLAEMAKDQAELRHWLAIDLITKALVQSHRIPALESPMRLFSYLGSGYVLVPLNIGLFLLLLRQHRGLAMFVPAITGGSVVVEGLTKWIVARPRPRLTGYGFPSGHVLVSVVFFGALIYLFWTVVTRPLWRWIGTVFCTLVIAGVAYSRLYLNAHWLTDVLGAFAGGTTYLLFGLLWIDGRRRQSAGQHQSPRRTSP